MPALVGGCSPLIRTGERGTNGFMAENIGLVAFWKDYDRRQVLRAVKLADELGYHSFWVPEAWGYEVFSLMTEMAVHTTNIRLGTGIANVFSRSPGLMAMSAATLDEISEGRCMLGIGASAKRVIEGFHGREFHRPLTQIRDVVRVVRALVGGGTLDDSGAELRQYRKFALAMTPSRSRIPIYVAALKQKSIASIGELADGWIPTFWPYERLGVGRDWIAEGAARSGRDPGEITCAPFTTVLPLGGDAAAKQAKDIVAFYIGGMGDYYRELLTGFGYGEECQRIASLYRQPSTRGEAQAAVTDEMVEALMVTGDGPQCIAELRRRRDFGMDLPILNLPSKVPWPILEAFLRTMAPRTSGAKPV